MRTGPVLYAGSYLEPHAEGKRDLVSKFPGDKHPSNKTTEVFHGPCSVVQGMFCRLLSWAEMMDIENGATGQIVLAEDVSQEKAKRAEAGDMDEGRCGQ